MLPVCSQRVCLLKLLRSQGFPIQQLHMIFGAFILSCITSALPAWGRQVTCQLQERLNAFLKRVKNLARFGTIDYVREGNPQPYLLTIRLLGASPYMGEI